jgi:hypothetical protein
MSRRVWAASAAVFSIVIPSIVSGQAQAAPAATPQLSCRPTDKPELGMQGRVTQQEVDSGRAAQGYTCNTSQVGQYGEVFFPGGSGGFRVHRYVDQAGHECGIYDSTLLFPLNATTQAQQQNLTGVYVLDMSDPANPVKTANLLTPAMQSPHESLSINLERGLLAADMGYPSFQPGFVDVYSLEPDCRQPQLLSSTPLGILGHEGTFSPDGNTFWVASTGGSTLTAIDLTDPRVPVILWQDFGPRIHGMNLSDDGNTLYAADTGDSGLTIYDVSQVQARVPNPVVTEISHLTWPTVSIPQTNLPVTIDGNPYLVEIDEYGHGSDTGPGVARIIDIANPARPQIVSDIRLEVHQPENWSQISGDPGASFVVQGYAGHYCGVPRREDPKIVACSMIASGLRIFNIEDPFNPVEIGYFNAPVTTPPGPGFPGGAFAMSQPAFDVAEKTIWYSDGNAGFFAVKVADEVWPEGL